MLVAILLMALQIPQGWTELWGREPGAGTLTLEGQIIRIDYTGEQDWSLARTEQLTVAAGDIVEASCRMKADGPGSAGPCFTAYKADGTVANWSLGQRRVQGTDWADVKAIAVVPDGVVKLTPRVIGYGKARVWIDNFVAGKRGRLDDLRPKGLPDKLQLLNKTLFVTFDTHKGTFAITDRRNKKSWTQSPLEDSFVVVSAKVDKGLTARLLDARNLNRLTLRAELVADKPEMMLSIDGEGAMPDEVQYPAPFDSQIGTDLIIPMNEGVTFPVDDTTLPELDLVGYGGHGICMGFYGTTDGHSALMTLIETTDDFYLSVKRRDGMLRGCPVWQSQKGRFGYARKWRYVFFDKGGYVAMAKRYREHAKQIGLLKTLREKAKTVPAIDLLVGAPNIWIFTDNNLAMARKIKEAGVERFLWSNGGKPDEIAAINEMGILTSRYDIVQDVMNPADFPRLNWVHPDWPRDAWPKDLVIKADGDWERGWEVDDKEGKRIPCGVLCDRQAVPYLDKRMNDELATNPYRCRFIDTTTASPWRECYATDHLMTRTESRKYKMDLLKLVSDKYKLVCGSETGHEAAVPYASYFEGMLSLGPFRCEDAGREMAKPADPAPPQIVKFQVGERYRLPLWELVFHDCLCAHWYWGDTQNKVPSVWDRRDLFNILYGTAPMLLFNEGDWDKYKARMVQSCKKVGEVARAVGYAEMVAHRYLMADRTVQQSTFSNGIVITVNFGKEPYELPDGRVVGPMGYVVDRESGIGSRKGPGKATADSSGLRPIGADPEETRSGGTDCRGAESVADPAAPIRPLQKTMDCASTSSHPLRERE